jgi:hypothetical protein
MFLHCRAQFIATWWIADYAKRYGREGVTSLVAAEVGAVAVVVEA